MKALIGIIVLTASMFAQADYVSGKGEAEATSGFYVSAKDSKGVNLLIKGKAARVLFDELSFSDDGQVGVRSGQQIRQSDFIQCVKYSKRDIACRLLINSDGTPATMPRLYQNH